MTKPLLMPHVRYKWRGRAKEMVIKKLFSLTFKKTHVTTAVNLCMCYWNSCLHCAEIRDNFYYVGGRSTIYSKGSVFSVLLLTFIQKRVIYSFFYHTFSFVTVDKPFTYFRSVLFTLSIEFSINECWWRHLINKKMDSIWHKTFELTEMTENHLLVPY